MWRGQLRGMPLHTAGVDDASRGELISLAAQFDLDLFMTGYDLWAGHYDLARTAVDHTVSALLLVRAAPGSSPTAPATSPPPSVHPAPVAPPCTRWPPLSTEPAEGHVHDQLHGEEWTRLLAAARRKLERTGGVLDGDIGPGPWCGGPPGVIRFCTETFEADELEGEIAVGQRPSSPGRSITIHLGPVHEARLHSHRSQQYESWAKICHLCAGAASSISQTAPVPVPVAGDQPDLDLVGTAVALLGGEVRLLYPQHRL
jgi:hypothetical protein